MGIFKTDTHRAESLSPVKSPGSYQYLVVETLSVSSNHMDAISATSTVAGLAIGSLVLCANFQFGLQTGWVSMMSMPAALLGFAWFKVLGQALSPQDNVYIQSVAVAVGTGPLSFGFVGALPAIQKLLTPEEGREVLGIPRLMAWSLSVSFMGIFTAVLLRTAIIRNRQLTFPSGAAAAALIGVIHDTPVQTPLTTRSVGIEGDLEAELLSTEGQPEYGSTGEDSEDNYSGSSSGTPNQDGEREETELMGDRQHPREDELYSGKNTYARNIRALATTFGVSSMYTALSRLVPVLRRLPILGPRAAQLMWTFEPSPAYIGQGIIMGLPTTVSMLLGAVLGWALLGPLAHSKGWAPGALDDWQTGAQGWIMWTSLAIMIADTGVSFVMLTVTAIREVCSAASSLSWHGSNDYDGRRPSQTPGIEHPASQRRVAVVGLVVAAIANVVIVKMLFPAMNIGALALAVIVSPALSLLGVRALGETDLNPVSSIAKLTQFLFGLLMRSRPHAVLLNIVAGAITEAGAQQAGDLMQDFKTGSLLGAPMTSQTIGMAVGTCWSVILSALVYSLYTRVYQIPGDEFRIPTAFIWADVARLMTGDGLPPHAAKFASVFGVVFVAVALAKKQWPSNPWLPSGVAVGIGMYNVPSFTLARFLGGVMSSAYAHYNSRPRDQVLLVILSSGLILGEGIVSVLMLGLSAFLR